MATARTVPAFDPASFIGLIHEPDRSRLLAAGHRTKVPARTPLTTQGTTPSSLCVLLSGTAEAVRVDQGGHETRVLSYGPGDAACLPEVCAAVPALSTVRTSAPAEVLSVPARVFRQLVTTPAVSEAAVSALATLAYTLEEHRLHGSYGNVRSLVCHWVLQLAARSGVPQPDGSVVVRCTQAELASWAGISREALVRHLRVMRLDGLVATSRGYLTIHDPEGLRAAADDGGPSTASPNGVSRGENP
ncbi:Crp/Fnr family transcriptional regulator [Isoptericola sediminis]|uniref:Crp/Fnr family transcriptional regulator n=1 Tax=Isoptericola sediminis TaxID=2733572 RepID=A0A849K3L9_9MICO|nr:Crp/Fnr family transcriptional regulator [Isoptericola sediminis]NNU27391.1 Crp/Fnr family transcriptional regulator [Isoptericola sediminis]